VVDYALKNEINVTLEAEDHRWTNFQLESYFALINAGYANLGTVLQTRLFRTEKDIARFDGRMRVRLVIGIYNEPGQIAHTDKRIMKDLLVQYGSNLLARGVYTELASHDTRCIELFTRKWCYRKACRRASSNINSCKACAHQVTKRSGHRQLFPRTGAWICRICASGEAEGNWRSGADVSALWHSQSFWCLLQTTIARKSKHDHIRRQEFIGTAIGCSKLVAEGSAQSQPRIVVMFPLQTLGA